LEEARAGAERAHDGDVEATGAEGGVGDVDDLVVGGVEGGAGGPGGHRLAGADLAGDDAERGLLDAVEDACDGLLVGSAGEELGWSQGLREGRSGEAEVGQPGCPDGHESCSSWTMRWRKEMRPVSAASWSARTWPR